MFKSFGYLTCKLAMQEACWGKSYCLLFHLKKGVAEKESIFCIWQLSLLFVLLLQSSLRASLSKVSVHQKWESCGDPFFLSSSSFRDFWETGLPITALWWRYCIKTNKKKRLSSFFVLCYVSLMAFLSWLLSWFYFNCFS